MPAHQSTPAEQHSADQVFAAEFYDAAAADQRLGDTQPPGPWSDSAADQEHARRLASAPPLR
jgi:hypothetical protein